MNNKEIDDLFKSRLDEYSHAPSPLAWERLERNIKREKTPWTLYFSVAASIVLLMVVSVLLVNNQDSSSNLTQNTDEMGGPKLQNYNTEVLNKPFDMDGKSDERLEVSQKGITMVEKDEAIGADNFTREDYKARKERSSHNGATVYISETDTDEISDMKLVGISGLGITANPLSHTNGKIMEIKEQIVKMEIATGIDNSNKIRRILDMALELKSENNAWAMMRQAKNEFLSLERLKQEDAE